MRVDQNLSPEDLEKLWVVEPDQALLEWSYRMSEMSAILEDPAPFVSYLTEQYLKNGRYGFDKWKNLATYKKLKSDTEAYESGKITLSDWLERARHPATSSNHSWF